MSATNWVEQILALPDTAARRRLVQQHAAALDDDAAIMLKEQADRFLESEVQRSLEIAELLLLGAELTDNPLFAALGLLAEANARSIGDSANTAELSNSMSRPQGSIWPKAISSMRPRHKWARCFPLPWWAGMTRL